MRKFWVSNKGVFYFILSILFFWQIALFTGATIGQHISLREKFIGPVPQANMDGIHYLYISHSGYGVFEQAFFPLFPLVIRFVSLLVGGNYTLAALVLVNTSLFFALFIFYKILMMDYSVEVVRKSLIFMLFFPTGFFFGMIYTESFFMLLVFFAFFFARKQKWLIAGIFGAMSSFTKFIGILLLPALIVEFLIIEKKDKKNFLVFAKKLISKGWGIFLTPLGLLSYIMYLWYSIGDPLAFFHVQSSFGANRSATGIIFLPQVLYRYFKILTAIPLSNFALWIAVLELSTFLISLIILCKYIKTVRLSYVIFSLLAIVVPTLTGTLSSEPRYVLVGFPIFAIFATFKKNIQRVLLISFTVLLIMLYAFFTRGYFIA